MWRDEYHSFQIAFVSTSVFDLFGNIKLEGHPPLWYLILFSLKSFAQPLFLMQLVNIIIAISSVIILLFKSNFNRFVKFTLTFNYLFLYEFNVFARNYAIGVLLLFLIAYYTSKPLDLKNLFITSFLVLFACLTNLCVIFILIGLLPLLYINFKENSKIDPKLLRNVFVGLIILLCIVLIYIILPQLIVRINKLKTIFHLLNKNILIVSVLLSSLIAVISCLYFFEKWYSFFKKNAFIIAFFITSTLIVFFFNFVYPGSLRHFGHVFIMAIILIWIFQNIHTSIKLPPVFNTIFLLIFLIQFPFLLSATYKEYKFPYSGISKVSEIIQKGHLKDRILIGKPFFMVEGLATALGKKYFYSFGYEDEISFISWDRVLTKEDMNFELVQKLILKTGKNAIIYSNSSLDKYVAISDHKMVKLCEVAEVISDEKAYVYLYNLLPEN